jgi:hypothetical protein
MMGLICFANGGPLHVLQANPWSAKYGQEGWVRPTPDRSSWYLELTPNKFHSCCWARPDLVCHHAFSYSAGSKRPLSRWVWQPECLLPLQLGGSTGALHMEPLSLRRRSHLLIANIRGVHHPRVIFPHLIHYKLDLMWSLQNPVLWQTMASFEFLAGPLLVLVCLALMWVRASGLAWLRTYQAQSFRSLFGLFTAQVYYYWSKYEHDPFFLRMVVLAIWLVCFSRVAICGATDILRYLPYRSLECLHSGLCIHMLYTYFIVHFNSTHEVDNIVWYEATAISWLIGISWAIVSQECRGMSAEFAIPSNNRSDLCLVPLRVQCT